MMYKLDEGEFGVVLVLNEAEKVGRWWPKVL